VDSARRLAGMLMTMPPQKRVDMLAGMQADEIAKLRFLKPDERQRLVAVLSPEERETFAAMVNPSDVITSELVQGKLLRAIYSERQLQEVMTDFWFNHFNIFIGKDADRFMLTAYERDVIRPNALGKFRDLLTAVARHPAMLYYLDNWLSVGPNSPQAQAAAKRAAANPANPANIPGLNENYARELMELHTLGVDGGYTQKDVTEVAKVFTGWSIQQPQQGGAFQFDPRRHEPGDKVVLGQTIHGSVLDERGQPRDGGEQEGLQVLDLLAQQPATAHFIARKLAIRFMSDDPPPALVEHMAQTFLASGGDIRKVLRTLFRSREFWSEGAYRAKTKTPLEYVVSAARASGADVQNPQPLQQALQAMGMPVYGALAPTGYKNTAEAWLNSDALLERLNFALALANGRLNGVHFDSGRMVASSLFAEDDAKRLKSMRNAANGRDVALALAEGALVAGGISRQTEKSIQKQLDDPKLMGNAALDPAKPLNAVAALVLGSPEFQKR